MCRINLVRFSDKCEFQCAETNGRVNMKLSELHVLCENHSGLIKFLQDRGVLISEMLCPKCKSVMTFSEQCDMFRCRKMIVSVDAHKRKDKKQCNTKISVLKGSWFSEVRIPLSKAILFIGYYLMFNSPQQSFLQFELDLSNHTVVDWSSFVREVYTLWCEDNSEKIGGVGKIVEIDESKIGHKKYNRGRVVEDRWVFGAFERGSKRLFVTVVPDRTSRTLLEVIKRWILPGTTIMSDLWRAYRCLEDEGYKHLTVNHSINFVDPETRAHTQNIERSWRDLKDSLQRYGTKEEHFHGYLCEYMFKRSVEFSDRIETFLRTVATHFSPQPKAKASSSDDGEK